MDHRCSGPPTTSDAPRAVFAEGQVIVPTELAASHQKYSGESGRVWVAALPALAAVCIDRWQLEVDGDTAFGAHDPDSGAMLLERLDASRDLSTMKDDLAAAEIIAQLLVDLNSVPAPAGLRRLRDVAAATLSGAPEAVRLVGDPEERRLLINCVARFQELITDPLEDRLLHWDLHYFNTLSTLDGVSEWKAIDPKPLSGDSGFELLPALWNRWDDLVETGSVARALLRRFDLMTEILEVDRSRAAGLTLGRVLQNAVWDLVRFHEGHIYPEHRTIAEVLLAERT
ncbi:MAG: Aminoglycoside/hydroxyurea antibiotic resistance kinase [Propionibacteriaceae bacterium]|nr:Aminoglycoside/hydroxyurea antibiotic resistance kinase [Propionibacteriaceae bacterium]